MSDTDRRAPARRMTVLMPASGEPLAKTIERDPAGAKGLRITPCADHARFDADEMDIAGHDELGAAVEMLSGMPHGGVVRGEPTPHARAEMAAGRPIRRLLRDRPGEPATLADEPKHWLCLDIDSYPAEMHDLQHGPAGVIEEMVASCLPSEFQDRTLYWRLSGTAGFKPGACSAHLWFWLEEARTGDQVRRWFEACAPDAGIDTAPFSANQIVFTSDALLGDGVHDPLRCRRGWLYGAEDEVALPLPPKARPARQRAPGEGVRPVAAGVAALDRMGDGQGLAGFHVPLRRASMLYARDVLSHGRPRDDEGEIILYRSAVEAAPCRDGRARRYATEHYLAALIESAFRRVERDAD